MEAKQKRVLSAGEWAQRLEVVQRGKTWDKYAIARATGASVRTVEGWLCGRHRPDRRSRVVLKQAWKEAKATLAQQEAEENG